MIGDSELERRFHQLMLDAYWDVGRATTAAGKPYWASRWLQTVRKYGGLRAAKRWLARPDAQMGFERMLEVGLVHLSLEAIVLQQPWSQLFTADELATAHRRLARIGYEARPKPKVK